MRSRKEIQKRVIDGLNQSFDRSVDLTLYLRACERLLIESKTARAEADDEQAYFVMLRLVELVVNYIPRHPDAKKQVYAPAIKRLNRTVSQIMLELDPIKANLDHEYERFVRKKASDIESEAKRNAAVQARRREVELAKDMKSRELGNAQRRVMDSDRNDIQSRFRALQLGSIQDVPKAERPAKEYSYPSLDNMRSTPQIIPDPSPPTSIPERPPKVPAVPDRPDDPVTNTADRPTTPLPTHPTPRPPLPEYQFSSPATLENGDPLKTVFVPTSLRSTFLSLAASNTSRNLETCGILCGSLKNNAYFITTLIVPKQTATSDTCHTVDEESVFGYQDANDLFTLGWCHTHPTQSCFMSSVDLHTQCSYQLMLPESIAIVYAPSRDPSEGVFRVTQPPGMGILKGCRKTGLFHLHEEVGHGKMYRDARYRGSEGVGHVRELDVTFNVVDQR